MVNLDGRLLHEEDAHIACNNATFRYGFGLFETLLVTGGKIHLCKEHYNRLFSGMAALGLMSSRFSLDFFTAEIEKTIAAAGNERCCRIRFQVFAGDGAISAPELLQFHYLVECRPLPDHTVRFNPEGLTTGILEGPYKANDCWSRFKTSNAMIYVVAAQYAAREGYDDMLVQNSRGAVIESSIANIFQVKDNIIYTPPASDHCIVGVMRNHILDRLAEHKIPFEEKSLFYEDLADADELFLTNSIYRIRSIGKVGNIRFDSRVFAEKIYALL